MPHLLSDREGARLGAHPVAEGSAPERAAMREQSNAMLKLGEVAMQPECSASAPLRRRLPSATTRSRSTRRGWIRWAEPLIEVGADVHGRIDGPARDAVLREIFALLCPLAGGWSTPEYGAKGEFCQL